jgi:hypothetical protein
MGVREANPHLCFVLRINFVIHPLKFLLMHYEICLLFNDRDLTYGLFRGNFNVEYKIS